MLVARARRKKREENSVSTFGRFRLLISFESSPVSVDYALRDLIGVGKIESPLSQSLSGIIKNCHKEESNSCG